MLEALNLVGKVLVKCVIIELQVSLLQQKHVEKNLKFKVGPLNINLKKFSTFLDAKLVMILPMLANAKFRLSFNNYKVNADLFEKENRMYLRPVFIHTMFKIATKVFMIGK